MQDSMINRLKMATVEERPSILSEQYEKNLIFLKERFPEVVRYFQSVKCPYCLNLTDSFVDVVNEETGAMEYPNVGLDRFAEVLGDWIHDTWVDLFNFQVVAPDKYPMHHTPIKKMHRKLMTKFPEYPILFSQRKINLKELPDGRRFSPPVIFLGVFHGLHIDYFLDRTEVDSILLIEPEPERFEVSCYFLDYEQLYKRFDRMMISIGPDTDAQPIHSFFSNYRVSTQMWTRVLPGYAHEKNKFFLESFKMYQATLASVIYPIEFEILGIQHASQNLSNELPFLSLSPKLSRKSRIAVVATGPSLDEDLTWLKKNKDKLIIFAVASAVSSLKANGIRPDFQFTLESHMTAKGLVTMEMSNDVPTVVFSNANEETVDYFAGNVFLCASYDKASPVEMKVSLPCMNPSTTNFTFSFACFCQPKELYLLGCDFGYFSIEKHHSASSFYKDIEDKSKEIFTQTTEMKQVLMAANFGAKGGIQSNPFLTQTRLNVERCIEKCGDRINFFNLSNGAMVKGAKPKQSSRIKFGFYKEKKRDVHTILSSFKVAAEGVNYTSYPTSGGELIKLFKEKLKEKIILDDFQWKDFTAMVDCTVYAVVKECRDSESDLRVDIYSRLLIDLLATWYSTLIFFDSSERAGEVYEEGLLLLQEAIDELAWAEDMVGKDDIYPLLKAAFQQSS